jgi:hypothetical protein
MTNYLKEQYRLKESDVLLAENKSAPLILGSVTRFSACQMSAISAFTLSLEAKHNTGANEAEKAVKLAIEQQNGIFSKLG